jgi:hypothetical protein
MDAVSMSSPKKAVTLQQRFGFQDHELTTPAHDSIMLWLDEYIPTFLDHTFGEIAAGRWAESERREKRRWSRHVEYNQSSARRCESPQEADLTNPPSRPGLFLSKVWEAPIKNGSFLIGFVDMLVTAKFPELELTIFDDSRMETKTPPKWDVNWISLPHALFEVKPHISSLGEVIRQVRMYETYVNLGDRFFVVCPDARFAQQLEAQSIGFLQCPLSL